MVRARLVERQARRDRALQGLGVLDGVGCRRQLLVAGSLPLAGAAPPIGAELTLEQVAQDAGQERALVARSRRRPRQPLREQLLGEVVGEVGIRHDRACQPPDLAHPGGGVGETIAGGIGHLRPVAAAQRRVSTVAGFPIRGAGSPPQDGEVFDLPLPAGGGVARPEVVAHPDAGAASSGT